METGLIFPNPKFGLYDYKDGRWAIVYVGSGGRPDPYTVYDSENSARAAMTVYENIYRVGHRDRAALICKALMVSNE